jgi:quinol monooxygenase YgiN
MWAQLIKMSLRPGHEQDLESLFGMLHASEQPDSGLLRTITMRDQADPSQIHTLVLFESEEKARAREADPRRGEGMAAIRGLMTEMFDGAPEFTNLEVLHDA